MSLFINNRRYIGSKSSLLHQINEVVGNLDDEYHTFCDLFAGTGVVGSFFADQGYNVILNDILYSNVVAYNAFLGEGEYDIEKLKNIFNKYNQLKSSNLKQNYFSKIYSDKYFHRNDAKKIGYIRDDLEQIRSTLTEKEYYIILTSLLYTTDRIANTVGHFEHFLKKEPIEKGIHLKELYLQEYNVDVEIYKEDANLLVKKISSDIVYIDPPYNARQYVNFYHVLENLANWNKPKEFEGTSMKFKRNHLKSDYSKSKAPIVFKDLIDNLDCKVIVVSYNNTYNARSGASNNKISEEQLFEILSSKGETSRVEVEHKHFNAGKTNFKNHKEYLYVCKVGE